MGSDSSRSNINEIKDISPYGAPNKNLAMPDLTGKPEISRGLYRLYNANGITIDYNIYNGTITINGTPTIRVDYDFTSILETLSPPNIYSYYYVGGTAPLRNF